MLLLVNRVSPNCNLFAQRHVLWGHWTLNFLWREKNLCHSDCTSTICFRICNCICVVFAFVFQSVVAFLFAFLQMNETQGERLCKQCTVDERLLRSRWEKVVDHKRQPTLWEAPTWEAHLEREPYINICHYVIWYCVMLHMMYNVDHNRQPPYRGLFGIKTAL